MFHRGSAGPLPLWTAVRPTGFTPLQLAPYFGAPARAAALIGPVQTSLIAEIRMRNPSPAAAGAAGTATFAALLSIAGPTSTTTEPGWTPLRCPRPMGMRAGIPLLGPGGSGRRNDDGKTAAEVARKAATK